MMIRGILNKGSIVYVFALICYYPIVVSSCRGHEDELHEAVRPYCEKSSVVVAVGETIHNRVLDASVVEVVSFSDIVDVSVVGTVMNVTGLASGDGMILLSADGQRLQCRVTVMDVRPDRPQPESPEEIAAQLADASPRFSIGKRIFAYGSVGNLFSLSSDGRCVSAASLVTGENASVVMEKPLGDMGTGKMGSVNFSMNDNNLVMKSYEVAGADVNATWIHGVTDRGEAIWVVIPRGFFD